MNNYEEIKGKTIDEMAEFIFSMVDCVSCTGKIQIKPECNGDGRKCLTIIRKRLIEEPMTVTERLKKKAGGAK
jgi:hypothetical protein